MKIIASHRVSSMKRQSMPLLAALALTTAAATGSGCGSSTDAGSSEETSPAATASSAALDQFWRVFGDGAIDQAANAQDVLLRAYADDPKNADLASVLGMSFNWRLAENARAKTPLAPPQLGDTSQNAVRYLTEATKSAPDNPKKWGFLAGTLYSQGLRGDSSLRAQGLAMMKEKVLPTEGVFATIALADVMRGASPRDPDFAVGVEYRFQALDACFGRKLDRDQPDLHGYEDNRTTTGPLAPCWNQAHVPHLEEGNFLLLGDSLIAMGKVAAAKLAYEAATRGRDYASWQYRSVVDGRLTEDLEARAALYKGDPANFPSLGGVAARCEGCHGK